jgi:hypothetical protein
MKSLLSFFLAMTSMSLLATFTFIDLLFNGRSFTFSFIAVIVISAPLGFLVSRQLVADTKRQTDDRLNRIKLLTEDTHFKVAVTKMVVMAKGAYAGTENHSYEPQFGGQVENCICAYCHLRRAVKDVEHFLKKLQQPAEVTNG